MLLLIKYLDSGPLLTRTPSNPPSELTIIGLLGRFLHSLKSASVLTSKMSGTTTASHHARIAVVSPLNIVKIKGLGG